MSTVKFVKRGSKYVIDKDPDSSLDYVADFSEFLLSDTDSIASVATETYGGVTVDSTEIAPGGQEVVVWVSGGTPTVDGDYAYVTVRITTVNNPARIEDRTMYFNVVEQ
jgi:hypothetical protein